jgi:flagellar export protein FliJ
LVFRFRLERVLRYREEQERQALISLARTQAQRDMVSKGLILLERELEEVRGFFNGLKGAQVEAQQLLLISQRWRWLSLEKARQSQLLQEWEKKVEKAHELWLHFRTAKEALLRLRQKAFREFVGELERAESLELDEVGLRVFSSADDAGCLNDMFEQNGPCSKTP